MVPTELLPPETSSTDQVTFVLATPLIFAANCCVCLNVREATRGLTDTVLLGTWPEPNRLTACSWVGSLSLTVTYPDRDPAAEGVKVTLIVQAACPASTFPQLFVCEKSPLAMMLMMLSCTAASFVNVIAWEALLVPTF